MKRRVAPAACLLASFLMVSLGGCMSDKEALATSKESALLTATKRAQYEINCENVTSAVITSKISFIPYSSQRTEYTIGVRGCGKQVIYITHCLEAGSCSAISDNASILQEQEG
ncbi:hypothetical protein D3C81_1426190 [compost metagenome]